MICLELFDQLILFLINLINEIIIGEFVGAVSEDGLFSKIYN